MPDGALKFTVAAPRGAARLTEAALAAAATVLLALPALWNGFPLLEYDTGGYLARWYEGYLVPSRPAPYGLLLNLVDGDAEGLVAGIPQDHLARRLLDEQPDVDLPVHRRHRVGRVLGIDLARRLEDVPEQLAPLRPRIVRSSSIDGPVSGTASSRC